MTDIQGTLIAYGDRVFAYAVCAYLLIKYGGAIDALKGSIENLEKAITLLAQARKD